MTEPVGVPIDQARVTLVDGAGRRASVVTQSDGNYSIGSGSPSFTIEVDRDGYAPASRAVTLSEELPALRLDIEMPPLAPQADISGSWSITFEPHPQCHDMGFSSRTYRASIVQQGAHLWISMSGASFVAPLALEGAIRGASVSFSSPGYCDYYCYAPAPPLRLIESLATDKYLVITGAASTALRAGEITGAFSGQFTLTRKPVEPFEVISSCANDNHRVTLRR